ncbi:hypothetical protein [Janthinobacterium sp. HLS12-2]|uniref:hypothetical protein n=1 Tax=Janthinobacterium sp. HLS12-2 TaxID=1259324 RepID=UPI003F280945
MVEASSIFVGALGFLSALAIDETPESSFPSLPVVSAVSIDEIAVAVLLIGPLTLVEAPVAAICETVIALDGIAGLWSLVVLGSSVEVIFAFMM